MSLPDDTAAVTIHISVDEWRDIVSWMHVSLERDEQSPRGHFRLECRGTTRTWVTGDGDQLTVVHGDGPTPRGLADPAEPFTVLVNSRFFRGGPPQDATLTITQAGEGRRQLFDTDGVRTELPEHPGDFEDWRSTLESVTGQPVTVDTDHFRNACAAAAITPWGIDEKITVHAWMWVEDGALHLRAPWVNFPSTVVRIPLLDGATASAPVLIDTDRLLELLRAIDLPTTQVRLPPEDRMGPVGLRAGRYEAVLMPVDRWSRERKVLEGLLCEFLKADAVEVDDDGDYPVTSPEGHQLWVRLYTDADPVSVQVFSVLASRVEPTPGLFEELNAINAAAAHVKVLWAGDAVMAEVDLVAESLDLAELANALMVVRATAEKYQGVLSAFFAGPDEIGPGL